MTEFVSRKYGCEGYEVIIKTDSKDHYKAAEDFARRLIDHAKPMTNLERFRAMTDKEVAAFMMAANDCELHIPFCTEKEECLFTRTISKKNFLQWDSFRRSLNTQ